MRPFLKNNGLSVAMAALFFVSLFGHTITGRWRYNEEQQEHGGVTVSYPGYLRTGDFAESLFENWESEFLQMGAYIFLTASLVQRGSAESKKPEGEPAEVGDESGDDPRAHRNDPGAPGPVRRGGWRLALYSQSLGLAFLALFVLSFIGHALGGANAQNVVRHLHGEAPISTMHYTLSSTFWFESFQNWQSEFLSVVGIVVLSIFLRQRGSPESKPVHAPHWRTGA